MDPGYLLLTWILPLNINTNNRNTSIIFRIEYLKLNISGNFFMLAFGRLQAEASNPSISAATHVNGEQCAVYVKFEGCSMCTNLHKAQEATCWFGIRVFSINCRIHFDSCVLFSLVSGVQFAVCIQCSVNKARMFDRSLPIRKLLFRGGRDKDKSFDCNICSYSR